jgi:uncharacterized protein with HEPN domain
MPSPLFKKAAVALHAMLRYIEHAQRLVRGLTYEDYLDDFDKTLSVERCIEIISEASRRLPQEWKDRHPTIPWQKIAGIGNIYRHDYDDIETHMVWKTVTESLPPLRVVIEEEIKKLEAEPQ